MALAVDTLPGGPSLSLPQMPAGGRIRRAKVAGRHLAKLLLPTMGAGLAILLLAGGAQAQEFVIDQTRLYASSPEMCAALEADGLAAFEKLPDTVLSFSAGIQSMEFHCNFFDVKGRAGSNHMFVSAICEHPGEIYPDSLAIAPYDETTIQVVSAQMNVLEMAGVFDSSEGEGVSAVTLYHRCDNLSEIPVD